MCAFGLGSAKGDGSDCKPCKGNEYKPTNGSTACLKCPKGSYTSPP